MFILKSKHEEIVAGLRQQIERAEDLRDLFKEIVSRTGVPMPEKDGSLFTSNGSITWRNEERGMEDVETFLRGKVNGGELAILLEDYFGGKVFKQEATKVVELDEDGKATYHVTKQKPDKGYKYKLVRK
jgi:hypothetical protein